MQAIVISEFGGPEVLRIEERPVPAVLPGEVLIKVKAAGVNRPDVFQRKGHYPAPPGASSDIPGLEVSGEIVRVGSDVKQWKVGDLVCALLTGGGYAEYVSAQAGSCLPIPSKLTLLEAAAIPETLFTVWHNVFQRGRLQKDEVVLIYGGSGGIGSMAIQLCKKYGAYVITTASTEEKSEFCYSLGADRVLRPEEVNGNKIMDARSVDVILDSIGAKYFDSNIRMLKEEGRLVYINAMGGASVKLDVFKLMQKRITITGSTLRPRSDEFKEELGKNILEKAFPLLDDGFVSPVEHVLTFQEARTAHEIMESRNFVGKIILTF